MIPSPQEAYELLKQYNSDPFHLAHGRIVGEVLRWYAADMGHAEEADLWQTVGTLHDLDFEMLARRALRAHRAAHARGGASTRLWCVACCSHGWGLTGTPYEPESVLKRSCLRPTSLPA